MPRPKVSGSEQAAFWSLAIGAGVAAAVGHYVPHLIWWGYPGITFLVGAMVYPQWLEIKAHETIVNKELFPTPDESPPTVETKPLPKAKKVSKLFMVSITGLLALLVFGLFQSPKNTVKGGFANETTQAEAKAQGFTTVEQWNAKLAFDKSQAERAALQKATDDKMAEAKAMIENLKAQQVAEAEQTRIDAACPTDPECQFTKAFPTLSALCEKLVEHQAKYDFKWDTGWFGQPWQAWGWTDSTRTEMFVSGHKISMMNAYGAWIPQTYSCTYSLAKQTITSVEVVAGR